VRADVGATTAAPWEEVARVTRGDGSSGHRDFPDVRKIDLSQYSFELIDDGEAAEHTVPVILEADDERMRRLGIIA
jgi:hypothetical protein